MSPAVLALGEFSLWVSFSVAVWGSALAFIGGRRARADLTRLAGWGACGVAALVVLSMAVWLWAFVADEFSLAHVYEHSSVGLHPLLKLAAPWNGHPGPIFLWALTLVLIASGGAVRRWVSERAGGGAERTGRGALPDSVPDPAGTALWSNTLGTLLAVAAGALLATLVPESPFERTGFVAFQGRGMPPALQSGWMMVHAPIQIIGLALLSVPFALGVGVLLAGPMAVPGSGGAPAGAVSGWEDRVRVWTTGALVLVAVGILIGMRWGYEGVGRGGYWSWGAGQNAMLLTWLAAAALLHTLRLRSRTGGFEAWTLAIGGLAFVLSLGGVAAGRPGPVGGVPVGAVHPAVAQALVVAGAMVAAGYGTLVAQRVLRGRGGGDRSRDRARGSIPIDPPAAALLATNTLLLALILVIGWGAVGPRVIESVVGIRGVVGPVYFERMAAPLALLALVAMAAEPLLARWGSEQEPGARRRGALVAHAGAVLALLGVGAGLLNVEARETLQPDDTIELRSPLGSAYTLRYTGLSSRSGRTTWDLIATFRVDRNGESVGFLSTVHRIDQVSPGTATRAGIRPGVVEDLRVALVGLEEGVGLGNDPERQGATVEVSVRPFASWIWAGGAIFLAGLLLTAVTPPPVRPVMTPALHYVPPASGLP